jgi:hypothetical protein
MSLRRVGTAVFVALALVACGDDEEESGNYGMGGNYGEEEEAEIEEADAAPEAEPTAAVAVVDPVGFRDLLAYLPSAGDGWQAGTPDGSTTSMGDYKVTNVSNTYTSAGGDGSPDRSITVQITDGGFAEMVSAPFAMMSQFSNETTQGYQKGVTIEGHPGYEEWNEPSRSSNLNVLVAKRFLIHLSGTQVEPQVLREWLEGMKLDELSELAKS